MDLKIKRKGNPEKDDYCSIGIHVEMTVMIMISIISQTPAYSEIHILNSKYSHDVIVLMHF
jgi:hypothetical protein